MSEATPTIQARHQANAHALGLELQWLQTVIDARIEHYFQQGGAPFHMPPPPELDSAHGPFAALLRSLKLDAAERLVLILALAPHLAPQALDPFLMHNKNFEHRFTEFGGVIGHIHNGVLPTAETAVFLLTGGDLALRLTHRQLFSPKHRLIAHGVLQLDLRHAGEPPLSAVLSLTSTYLEQLLSGDETVVSAA